MGSFIAQQPNGLYCRYSTVVGCPTHWNLTREDYLNNVTGTVSSQEEGEDVLDNYLRPFSEIEALFTALNMTQREFNVLLRIMYTSI
ncbi:hypothetical protein [Exiguobacterium sp. s133]|uniref:hypothetical protein n=1 Tax=Exiguobacterium sp. s133 TaxID=2751213 RepID=UPI001BE7FE8F|nr:hypothetical protein [Exiguobacterium sp. s133]